MRASYFIVFSSFDRLVPDIQAVRYPGPIYLTRGFSRKARKCFQRIFQVIWLWDPHLFLMWGFEWFLKHSIFGGWVCRLGWSDFDQFGGSGGVWFLTRLQTTTLSNFAIKLVTLNTLSSKA